MCKKLQALEHKDLHEIYDSGLAKEDENNQDPDRF